MLTPTGSPVESRNVVARRLAEASVSWAAVSSMTSPLTSAGVVAVAAFATVTTCRPTSDAGHPPDSADELGAVLRGLLLLGAFRVTATVER